MRRTLLVITALLLAVLAPTKASASPASAAAPVGLDPGSLTVVAETPVVIKSLDYTILDADQSSVFVGNC